MVRKLNPCVVLRRGKIQKFRFFTCRRKPSFRGIAERLGKIAPGIILRDDFSLVALERYFAAFDCNANRFLAPYETRPLSEQRKESD